MDEDNFLELLEWEGKQDDQLRQDMAIIKEVMDQYKEVNAELEP